MTFGHSDVAVGLDDVVGAVVDEVDHRVVKHGLHGHEIVHLLVVKVLVNGVAERWREDEFVAALACVGAVTLSELPDEHGRQIVLVSSQQHVSSSRNTRLEVVRDGGVSPVLMAWKP